MGTVKTHGDLAKLKIRDSNDRQFTDTNRLSMINDILETIYQKLCFIESNLVYAEGTITLGDGTEEYTPSFAPHNGFLDDGVWLDGEDTYLTQVTEADKVRYDYGSTTSEPEAYYLTEDGKVGFLWVPDDTYTVHVQYWNPLTVLTDYDNDDLPWGGIWDRVIQRLLVVEMLEVLERDNSRQALLADIEENSAMNMVYKLGVRPKRQVSDMFNIGGV